jgi:hypothetical protein
MQCDRLIKMAKQWFLHVKEETMAPARMVQFIKQHVASCPICLEDPDIEDEIVRITEIILPDSKIPKAVRMKQEAEEAERHSAVEEVEEKVEEEASEETEGTEENGEDEFVEEEEVEEEEPLSPDAPQ